MRACNRHCRGSCCSTKNNATLRIGRHVPGIIEIAFTSFKTKFTDFHEFLWTCTLSYLRKRHLVNFGLLRDFHRNCFATPRSFECNTEGSLQNTENLTPVFKPLSAHVYLPRRSSHFPYETRRIRTPAVVRRPTSAWCINAKGYPEHRPTSADLLSSTAIFSSLATTSPYGRRLKGASP